MIAIHESNSVLKKASTIRSVKSSANIQCHPKGISISAQTAKYEKSIEALLLTLLFKVNKNRESNLADWHVLSDFFGMETTQLNIRISRGMLDAIESVSGGKARGRVPVYIRQAIALMLRVDGVKVCPEWVELSQGKRNDMNTPDGRNRARQQLAGARQNLARRRLEKKLPPRSEDSAS